MLDSENLTDRQFALACEARKFPVIVSHGKLTTARALERRMWGDVENGCGTAKIFRLNQDGCDALAWLDDLRETPEERNAYKRLAAELDALLGI